jgi:hypothetical protein
MTTRIKKHTFRTAYNLGNENYSETHANDGLTEQHHANDCDINKILSQFMETGILPQTTNRDPVYGDVSEHDFQDVQIQLANAKSLFEELPDTVRAQFDNEPFKFLHFAEDPKNLDALVDMGLATAPKKDTLVSSSTQAEDANSGTEIASDKSSDASEKSDP